MTKQKKKSSPVRPVRVFENAYRFGAVLAVGLVIAPWYDSLLSLSLSALRFLAVPVSLALLFFGYLLQSLAARLTGLRRTRDSSAYEEMEPFFDPGAAIVPLLLACAVGFGLSRACDAFLRAYAASTPGIFYDRHSLLPFLLFALTAGTAAGGVALWFYPFNRILSLRTLFPYGISFLLNFCVNSFILHLPTNFGAVCLLLFTFLTVLLLNQSGLIRAIDRAGSGTVTREARGFNAALAGVFLLLLLLLLFLASSLITGVAVLFRMVLYGLAQRMNPDPDRDVRSLEEKTREFSDRVFGGEKGMMSVSSGAAGALFTIFCVLLVLAVLALLLFFVFKKGRNIRAWIRKAFRAILDFLQNAFHYMKNAPLNDEEEAIMDYVDVSVKMDPNAVPTYSRPSSLPRDYRSILRSLPTDRARIEYAYRLLVSRFGEDVHLNVCDTPLQIEKKVLTHKETPSLPTITEAFQTVHYAEREAVGSGEVLEEMCTILDRYARRE